MGAQPSNNQGAGQRVNQWGSLRPLHYGRREGLPWAAQELRPGPAATAAAAWTAGALGQGPVPKGCGSRDAARWLRSRQFHHLLVSNRRRRLPGAHSANNRLADSQSGAAVGVWAVRQLESGATCPPERLGVPACAHRAVRLQARRGPSHGGFMARALRVVASDSNARWRGSTTNAADPFSWLDKRISWHQLVEGNPMPGGHA